VILKTIYCGAAGKDHKKIVYNDAVILLSMAIADNVLVGIKSIQDLQALEIPPGDDELRLIYADGVGRQGNFTKMHQGRGRHRCSVLSCRSSAVDFAFLHSRKLLVEIRDLIGKRGSYP